LRESKLTLPLNFLMNNSLTQNFNNYTIFEQALGLTDPWNITDVEFSAELKRLDIQLGYKKGCKFHCSKCSKKLSIYSTNKRTWKHLNFFQHEAYLHLKLPRIKCIDCKAVRNVPVPWARPGSGFTLLFEAFTMELAQAIPLTIIGGIVSEYSDRLMRIINFYVTEAREKVDMSQVINVCIDETSTKRGHRYVTIFTDPKQQRVLFATQGKDNQTVKRFAEDLKQHQADSSQIKDACIDLSPAFIKGVNEHLPEAEITFDSFHIMQLVNKRVDQVRRQELKENPVLKNSRYCWLKNPDNLTDLQKDKLDLLSKKNLKTSRAYQIRLTLQDIYKAATIEEAEELFNKWYFWATHSRIKPIIKVAKTINKHWYGIANYFRKRLSNGLSEGINSIIQGLKRRARGYKNTENLITMVYLLKGNLNFNLPTVTNLTYYR
jgi:transposase